MFLVLAGPHVDPDDLAYHNRFSSEPFVLDRRIIDLDALVEKLDPVAGMQVKKSRHTRMTQRDREEASGAITLDRHFVQLETELDDDEEDLLESYRHDRTVDDYDFTVFYEKPEQDVDDEEVEPLKVVPIRAPVLRPLSNSRRIVRDRLK